MRLDHEPFSRTYISVVDLFSYSEITTIKGENDREDILSYNFKASDVACDICKNLTKFGRCRP